MDVPAGVTQDFLYTFLLRCMPLVFSQEGFSRSSPSSTVKSNLVCFYNDIIVLYLMGIFFFFFFFSSEKKSQLPRFELASQRVRRLQGYQLSYQGDWLTVHLLKRVK